MSAESSGRWGCPNDPPCGHYWHDVEDFDDPVPTCCHGDCRCGKTEEHKRLRHELLYGRQTPVSDFYEDDLPAAEALAAFDCGDHGVTGVPYPTRVYGCQHMTIAGPLSGAPTTTICACELLPVQTS